MHKAFSRGNPLGGMIALGLIIALIVFCAGGHLSLPLTNWLSKKVTNMAESVTSAGSIEGLTERTPLIGAIQQNDDASSLEAVIIQQQSADDSMPVVNEPISEMNTQIFDLGSISPAGFLEDGTPYFDNGDGTFYKNHKIMSGDTLWNLCNVQYDITESEFMELNEGFRISDYLFLGHVYKILVRPEELE